MPDACKSISVSGKIYAQLRQSLNGESLQGFIEEIIESALDDPSTCDRLLNLLNRCPQKRLPPPPTRSSKDKDTSQGPLLPVLRISKEPKELRGKSRAKRRRLRKYELTEERLEQMYRTQNGRCWICDQPFGPLDSFVIDHCHRTHKVRGLLCNECNLGLGNFRDCVSNLIRAVMYLDPGHEITALCGER